MGTKVIINKKTGMAETVTDWDTKVTPEQVAETRRKLRDMLGGNTQFHQDDWEKEKPKEAEDEEEDEAPSATYMYGGVMGGGMGC